MLIFCRRLVCFLKPVRASEDRLYRHGDPAPYIYIYTYILLLVRHTCRLTYKQHMWAEPLLNQRIACVEYVFFRGKGKCFLISMQHVQHVIMTACAPAPERHMVQPSHGFCWLHQSCICVFFFKNNRFS